MWRNLMGINEATSYLRFPRTGIWGWSRDFVGELRLLKCACLKPEEEKESRGLVLLCIVRKLAQWLKENKFTRSCYYRTLAVFFCVPLSTLSIKMQNIHSNTHGVAAALCSAMSSSTFPCLPALPFSSCSSSSSSIPGPPGSDLCFILGLSHGTSV